MVSASATAAYRCHAARYSALPEPPACPFFTRRITPAGESCHAASTHSVGASDQSGGSSSPASVFQVLPLASLTPPSPGWDSPTVQPPAPPSPEPEDDEEQGGWVEWPGYAAKTKQQKETRGENDAAPRTVRAPPRGFGSFHHQYRVDGRLVAVGVVDVLPKCLSSKYFFWEPSFAWASLGKLGALREIEWVAEAGKECLSLQYYYLGYYIHNCAKVPPHSLPLSPKP